MAGQVRALTEAGYAVVLCTGTAGGAERLSGLLAEEGLLVPVAGPDDDLSVPGARIVVATVDRGFVLPGSRVAVLAESDVTGRMRPHRQARTRARPVDGFFDDLAPGSYVVHRQHGVALYGGMVTRTMGGATRDYLLLEYRGGDRLYLPTDQIELLTPYAGGDSPTVNRLGGSEWQKARSKARAAVHEIAEELVALYRRRLEVPGPRLRARHAVAGRARVVVPVRRDLRPAAGHRGRQGRHGAAPAHGPAGLRRRRLRQDGGGHPRRVQGRPGRLPGRRAGADHTAGQPARPDVRRPVRAVPGEGRPAQPLPDQRPGQRGAGRTGRRLDRRGGRAPTACSART